MMLPPMSAANSVAAAALAASGMGNPVGYSPSY